ncbi:META domain-containing protein [Candidatus Enterovibrio escicola]|uniref:META domain-containing protein n=1 Tax=Candidatus Enterovibrio escicola TaxID=1927127 RepID=UPI001237C271|nr:META domain-containing protein [Candidatus Enterovibrio escacola]
MKRQFIIGVIALLLTSCQAVSDHQRLQTFILGTWKVEYIMGLPIIDRSNATLNFSEGNKVTGNNSCNNFFGKYSVEGNKVKLIHASMGSTKMMCIESLMRQADLVENVILLVTTAEIKAGRLNLFDYEGKSLLILSRV